ncbi:hypothetical protein S83_061700, partial [Arachis hypogaea]
SQSPPGHHHAGKVPRSSTPPHHHAESQSPSPCSEGSSSTPAHHHAESQSPPPDHQAVKVHRPYSAVVGRRTPPCSASLRLPPLPCSSLLFSCSSLPISSASILPISK